MDFFDLMYNDEISSTLLFVLSQDQKRVKRMNFKKSFVIKFQRSELLWKEKKYFVARNRNKKDDTNPRRKVKDYFYFFRWF